MARRTVNGNTHSENGWPLVDEGSCRWVRVPGAPHVSLQIQEAALPILLPFAADYHAYVEPLRDPDSACWTRTNSVLGQPGRNNGSNHLGATGMDLNWQGPGGKAFRLGITKEQAFPGAMSRELDALYDFYEGIMFCGGEWSIRDWMHHQLRAGTWDRGRDRPTDRVQDFIRRKIRSDGFSTYRRGDGAGGTGGLGGNQVDILARATGLTPQRAGEILPTMVEGLRLAQCTTVPRIAQFIAQTGHESDDFKATEEYAKNGRYAPYIGRTWIMITWDYNYRDFSKWAHARGLVPTPDYFVVNYRALADLRWAGIGAAWYWTEQRPMNGLVDAGESATWKAGDRVYRGFEAVTAAINGGLNGLADRRQLYNRAIALGDQLLALVSTSDPVDELEELMATKVKSLSIYATPGEGLIEVSTMIAALDAHGPHEQWVEAQARAGHLDSIRRVALTAGGGGEYKDPRAIQQAMRVLTEIRQTNPEYILAATGKA